MRLVRWMLLVAAALFVFGIAFVVVGARAARQSAQVPPATTLVPVATMKQLMNGIVNPAATVVFDSVSTTISDRGVEEVFPRTDEEWTAVGDSAAALAESGNLLMMDGRAIDAGAWMTMSQALIDAARQTQRAVEARSTDAVLEAGGVLYAACETCHQQYQR